MTTPLRSPFKLIDKYVDAFLSMPFLLKVMTSMTLIVIPVAIYHILKWEMYTNTAQASIFLKDYFIVNNLLLVTHILFALPATLFGPFLFHARFRQLKPQWHKNMGKIYVIGCLGGAITVFPLAVNNGGGTVAHIGFGSMAILWFFLTYFAYTAAVNKDFVAHRRWMMRSYALTFAFVHVNLTYRLFLPYDMMSIGAIKAMQSMVSWQANWLLVELYLACTTFTGKFLGWRQIAKNLQFWSKLDRIIWTARPLTQKT